MSVDPKHIDFAAASEAAAKKVLPNTTVSGAESGKIDFAAATAQGLKKKVEPQPQKEPSKPLFSGAAVPTSELSSSDLNKPFNFNVDYKKLAEKKQQEEPPSKAFSDTDKEQLNSLLVKHGAGGDALANIRQNLGVSTVPEIENKSLKPFQKEFDESTALEKNLQGKLADAMDKMGDRDVEVGGQYPKPVQDILTDLEKVQDIKKKAWREIVQLGHDKVDAVVRRDESGNFLNKTFNRLLAASPSGGALGGARISQETIDRIDKLPQQFATGLNYLEGVEPEEYKRIVDALQKGMPISESQVATIVNQGIDIESERLKRESGAIEQNIKPQTDRLQAISNRLSEIKPIIEGYEKRVNSKERLSPSEIAEYKNSINQYNALVNESKPLQQSINSVAADFDKKQKDLIKVREDNILNNQEVLRAFISEGVAEFGDVLGKATQINAGIPNKGISDYFLGHTWNYSDNEIKGWGEKYMKQNGFDPTDARVQQAIKYLQDNEGAMIMQNSIAKAGGIREFFFKGAAEPIRGTVNFIADLGKSENDIYAEGQSQGNVNVSEKRLKSEDTGIRGVINDVVKGAGQFATQAGMMEFGSMPFNAAGKLLLGRAGQAALAGDIAVADMGIKDVAGKLLTTQKNNLSVFTTSYAMAYDQNLKQALNYTSNNQLAKRVAMVNSMLEGATELFLSPLEIAEKGIARFSQKQTKDLLKIMADESLKDNPGKLLDYTKRILSGIAETAKVARAEIGEEYVTRIADYVTNAILNPNSQSFQNRDLASELGTTAYQTGLSMAIPALLSGVGAAKANGFSKGSLMVAGQNRQKMIDAYQKDLAEGRITQQQYNANVALVNTAAQANDELPKKADGTSLTTDEKANYIFSRVTEAMLTKKINSIQDAAEKKLLNKKVVDQQNYRAKILGGQIIGDDFGNEDNNPIYQVDGNDVSKKDLLRLAKSEDADKYHFRITGDVETLQKFQKIQGVDKDIEAAQQEQEKQKDAELLTTLKGKVSDIEYNELLKNPESSYQYIADQALGYTRKDGERVPHEFGGQEEQVRKLYGDAIVDKAIEKYPAAEPITIGANGEEVNDIEAKKADIERRRQEELDKETPIKNENVTVDFGGGLSVKYQVITYKDGSVKISTVSERAKRYNELSDETFKDYAKIDFESDAKGIIKTELVKDDYTDKQSQEIKAAKEKTINAKYDAELAELEKQGVNREEVVEPIQTEVFSALEKAAAEKIGVRAKNIAMAKVASEYGDIGERAMVINSNFDQIVSHLKNNNKIEVRCP